MKGYSVGFTLVELVVTILLIITLAVAALPRLPSWSGYALDGYCLAIKSGVRRVQAQAMFDVTASGAYAVTSSMVESEVSWSQPELTLDNSSECTGPNCSIILSLPEADRNRGISLSATQVEFDSMGRPENGAVEFTLSAPDGASEVISIAEEGYVDGC